MPNKTPIKKDKTHSQKSPPKQSHGNTQRNMPTLNRAKSIAERKPPPSSERAKKERIGI
jgi:hypothetical protein